MHIRTTTDPISLREVANPAQHPCVYEGDGDNGVEIYFESEENRATYLAMAPEEHKVLAGSDSDDYIPEG